MFFKSFYFKINNKYTRNPRLMACGYFFTRRNAAPDGCDDGFSGIVLKKYGLLPRYMLIKLSCKSNLCRRIFLVITPSLILFNNNILPSVSLSIRLLFQWLVPVVEWLNQAFYLSGSMPYILGLACYNCLIGPSKMLLSILQEVTWKRKITKFR